MGPISSSDIEEEELERFYACGYAHFGSGNFSDAAEVFSVLCTKNPLEQKFWFALGATLQEAGKYQEAMRSWAMAALLKKEDPYPHFHAAECCLSLEKVQEAAKALKESEDRVKSLDKYADLKSKIVLLKEQWSI